MTKRKDGLYQEAVVINGRRKYFYGHTKAEVMHKISAYREEQQSGHLFREVADMWQAEREKEVRYKTAEAYRAPVKRLCEHFGEDRIRTLPRRKSPPT